ncbi:hypothetical protein HDU98_010806 [Podochytrium sp. JEL0797]|nr:hypothetical protein HDU98_010806 [Podochytrium sp. JEL0797]
MEIDETDSDSNTAHALGRFLAGFAATPVDLVSLLRMVEYCPTDEFLHPGTSAATGSIPTHESEDEEEANGSDSDEDGSDGDTEVAPEADDYGFAYAKGSDAAPFSDADADSDQAPLLKNTDAAGYLIRAGGCDDPTRPPYETSIEGAGTFQGVSRIVAHNGFASLYNGK